MKNYNLIRSVKGSNNIPIIEDGQWVFSYDQTNDVYDGDITEFMKDVPYMEQFSRMRMPVRAVRTSSGCTLEMLEECECEDWTEEDWNDANGKYHQWSNEHVNDTDEYALDKVDLDDDIEFYPDFE